MGGVTGPGGAETAGRRCSGAGQRPAAERPSATSGGRLCGAGQRSATTTGRRGGAVGRDGATQRRRGAVGRDGAARRGGEGKRLPASTLIETVVASVIFLAVFAISLETLIRVSTTGKDETVYVEAGKALSDCFREYATGAFPTGEYEEAYEWGTVGVRVSDYGPYETLQEVRLVAYVKVDNRRIERRHVIEKSTAGRE